MNDTSNDMSKQKRIFPFVFILKCWAILLITNSHFGCLYPVEVRRIATGGALGNLAFFFCSGFTLWFTNTASFGAYLKRRVVRIYPAIWLVAVLSSLLGDDIGIKELVYPTGHWFIGAILAFYVVYYFVRKYLANQIGYLIVILGLCMLLVYVLWLGPAWVLNTSTKFVWLYYLSAFLLGGYLAKKEAHGNRRRIWVDVPLFMGFWAGYYVSIYYLRSSMWLLVSIFFAFGALVFLFRLSTNEALIRMLRNKWSWPVVKFIASLTLEIYLVQHAVIRYCVDIDNGFRAPIALGAIVLSAFIVNRLAAVFMWVFRSDVKCQARQSPCQES